MTNQNFEKCFNESRNIYVSGTSRGYSTLVSIFSEISKIPFEKSRDLVENYLYEKFLISNNKNFDKFLKAYLDEEGVQISADIPQAVRPERPVDEIDTKEEIEEEEGEEEAEDDSKTDSEDDELSDDDTIIENFLDEIGLLHLEEEEVERFVYRFTYVLKDTFDDEDTLSLIASLLYKARMSPENLSDAEKDELSDIIFHMSMNPEETEEEEQKESYLRELYSLDTQIFTLMQEKDDDKSKKSFKDKTKSAVHKIGVVSVLLGSTFLFGLGGLFASGLFLYLTSGSDDDLDKTKKEIDDNKDSLRSGKSIEIEPPKPVKNPTPAPSGSMKDIENKAEQGKENLVNKAKEVAANDPDFAKKQEKTATWKERFKSAAKYVGSKSVELLGKGARAVGSAVASAAEAGYDSAKTAVVSAYNSGSEWAKTTGADLVKSGWDATKSGVDKAAKYVGDKASQGADYVGDKIKKGADYVGKKVSDVKDKFKGDDAKAKKKGKGKSEPSGKKKGDSGKSEPATKITSKGDAQKYFDTKGKAPKGWESDPKTGKVYPKGSKPKQPASKKKPAAKKKPSAKKESYLYNLIF